VALAASALVFNAFVWGVSWWPFRELQSLGLHPLWSTSLIYFFSLACVTLVWPRAWRSFAQHPQLWLLAAAAGLTNVGFNWAVTVGDVVRVVLLFYLMPAWSVLLAWAALGERPTRASLFRLLLAMTGVLIVLKTPGSPWPVPQSAADWLALLGGLSFAATNVLLRKLEYTPSESRMTAMFGGGALLAGAGLEFVMGGRRPGSESGLFSQQHGLAIRRGTAGSQHHRAGDAHRDPVCQPVRRGAGCSRIQRPHPAGRRPDCAGGLARGYGAYEEIAPTFARCSTVAGPTRSTP
jgi:drug/metabolite transporter (DMT)-like permease